MSSPPLPRRVARATVSLHALMLAAALTALAAAAPAVVQAKVTWKGIGSVRLGMSEDRLRDRLGKPSLVKEASQGAERHTYRRAKMTVVVKRRRVEHIQTTSRAHRTPAGVRVGMTMRKMRRRAREEDCQRAAARLVCSIERRDKVLEFIGRRGRVGAIGLGWAE